MLKWSKTSNSALTCESEKIAFFHAAVFLNVSQRKAMVAALRQQMLK